MRISTRLSVLTIVAAVCAASGAMFAADAATVTFTANGPGTFSSAMKVAKGELTVDLSSLPKDAQVFRAELILNGLGHLQQRSVKPTKVFPAGQEDKPLKFVAPRFVGLDATAAVQEAVKAGKPLTLAVENTINGVNRLEVSYVGKKPDKFIDKLAVSNVKAAHRAGQSLITFTEPKLADFPEFKTGGDVAAFKAQLLKDRPSLRFRIWRSAEKIAPDTLAKAELVGEVGPLTCWNDRYRQDGTGKAPPLRYHVTDLGEEVPWGTGIYAHNPPKAGKAFYAVSAADNGQEDLSSLAACETGVDEVVGLGEPILQRKEDVPAGKEVQYRLGPVTRLMYTRWESFPHSSTPSNPIDTLVMIPMAPKPQNVSQGNAWKGAWRVEPAPVGLHLHCWGGSAEGGYGWWYNADRGAILIASTQIPYDWWTGYHEANGTSRSYGDGVVRPFTMNRVLGFLDWAVTQHEKAPEAIKGVWPKLDLNRVFTAGSSMGGAGAPMYPIRYGQRIAWCVAWVGVHVPEMSPGFKGSYEGSYGPRNEAITYEDGKTSPWDYFSDVWWLKNNPKAETGLIIASNGKDDGGIGWPQAALFAKTLQETRRPHYFNWALAGHGTRTLVGSTFNMDIRNDQTLPAFTHCSLDDKVGDATPLSKEQIEAEKAKQQEEKTAGKRKEIKVCGFDGDPEGQVNAHLSWQTSDIVDTPQAWEMTVILSDKAPKDTCTVDLTPRRLQQFKTPKDAKFKYTVTGADEKVLSQGSATADKLDLLTLKQITLAKGKNRVKIAAEK